MAMIRVNGDVRGLVVAIMTELTKLCNISTAIWR